MRGAAAAVLVGLALLVGGCGGWQSTLAPRGPAAAEFESLWWIAFLSTGSLSAITILGLCYAVRRALRADRARSGGSVSSSEQRFIVLAGVVAPALFLLFFLSASVRSGAVVSEPPGNGLSLEVVGHMFWWEVRYPDQEVVTANEIRIPVGVPVNVQVTSADVIHSFWVPQLGPGKVDMVPGRTNTIWLRADEPGVYRGQCTEFCGVQHAHMSLLVVASSGEEFEAWAARAREGPAEPEDPVEIRGREVFFEAGCAPCHGIRDVSRPTHTGTPGPDLSDLASRKTLGALTVPNDREHLTEWVRDPHQFKPGVRMPAHRLAEDDLQALVRYLETLR